MPTMAGKKTKAKKSATRKTRTAGKTAPRKRVTRKAPRAKASQAKAPRAKAASGKPPRAKAAGAKSAGGDDSARIDAYIAKSADFAKPILRKIRKLFHQACPQLEEQIKWGCPHFDYKGMLGGMAAFKNHVSFGFWKSKLMSDPKKLFTTGPKASMCVIKAGSPAELPPDRVLIQYVKEAASLNDKDIKAPRTPARTRKPLQTPADLTAALKKNAKARATFTAFSPSRKGEYIQWITEAKRDETRRKRLATAIQWMAAGKPRNWKYMPKK